METGFALGTKCKLNLHKKHEMYMTNAKVLRLVPNTTYIPLTHIGGFALGNTYKICVPNARDTIMLVFFALGNAKVLSFALGDAKRVCLSSILLHLEKNSASHYFFYI